MTIVALACVSEAFLLVLPESLDPRSHLVPVTDVATPSSLDSASHIVPVPVAHCF